MEPKRHVSISLTFFSFDVIAELWSKNSSERISSFLSLIDEKKKSMSNRRPQRPY